MRYYFLSFVGTDKEHGGTDKYVGSGWIAWDGYPPMFMMQAAISRVGGSPIGSGIVISFREMSAEEFAGVFGVSAKHGDANISFRAESRATNGPQLVRDVPHDIPPPTPVRSFWSLVSDFWRTH